MRPASTLRTSFLMLRGDGEGQAVHDGLADDVGGERLAEAGGDQALLGRVGRLRRSGSSGSEPAPGRARGARDREPGRRVEGEAGARLRAPPAAREARRSSAPRATGSGSGSGSARERAPARARPARAAASITGSGGGTGSGTGGGLGAARGSRPGWAAGRRGPPAAGEVRRIEEVLLERHGRLGARRLEPMAVGRRVAEKKSSCGLVSRAAAASASANGVACSNSA